MWIRYAAWFVLIGALAGWSAAGTFAVAATGSPASAGEDVPHGPEGGHGGGSGVNPLDFRADLALWTGVVFVLLVLVLWRYAWGPIADGLDKREKRIASDIASAEKANEDARALLARYEEKLAASEEVVRRMLEEARRDAEQAGGEMLARARRDAEAEHQRALDEIELAASAALKELAERSAGLAVELAGKIVAARLDKSSHARLIEEAVSGFNKVEPNRN